MNKKIKKLKGISLIVLVITILVLSILAATVIISLSNTNIISEANKAVLKSNIQSLQDRVTSYTADNYASIDMEKEYTLSEYGITEEEFKKYQTIAVVKGGKIYIKPNADSDILEVARELNVLLDGSISNTGSLELASTNVKSLRIYGNSIQNGTPSESTPVEIQSVGEKSKNLFDVNATIESSQGSDTIVVEGTNITTKYDQYSTHKYLFNYINVNSSEQYTISYKVIQGAPRIGVCLYDTERNIIDDSSIQVTNFQYNSYYKGYFSDSTSITITIPEEVKYIRVFLVTKSNTNKTDNIYSEVQVEKGDTATDYEPYGYKVPVRTSGKNLFNYDVSPSFGDASKKDNGYFSNWTTNIRFYTFETLAQHIGKVVTISFDVTVSESGTYEIYQYQNNGIGIMFNKVSKELLANTSTRIEVTGEVAELGTIEEYSKGEIIVFKDGYTGTYSINNIQFEEGSIATEYEPYNTTTYNIYLKEPLRKLGGTADYIDCTTGEVVRYIKVKDATGTKSIEESFEVLTTPITEKVSVSDIDYTNKKYVSVDTTVIPSSIETRY